jgi:hypothetical protein
MRKGLVMRRSKQASKNQRVLIEFLTKAWAFLLGANKVSKKVSPYVGKFIRQLVAYPRLMVAIVGLGLIGIALFIATSESRLEAAKDAARMARDEARWKREAYEYAVVEQASIQRDIAARLTADQGQSFDFTRGDGSHVTLTTRPTSVEVPDANNHVGETTKGHLHYDIYGQVVDDRVADYLPPPPEPSGHRIEGRIKFSK